MPPAPTLMSVIATTDEQRAVLVAADSLFTEHSIDVVELELVAQRAGVSRDDVEKLYDTKRDLLIAVLAHKHQGWVDRLEVNSRDLDDPRDEILGVFTYMEECFVDTTWRGCCFVNAYAEVGREDEGIASLAREHFDEVERHMADLCSRASIPDYVSDALTILIQGARAEAGIRHTAQPARSARIAAAMLMSVYEAQAVGPALF